VGGGPFTSLSMLTEGHCQVVVIPRLYMGNPVVKILVKTAYPD